MPKSPNVSTSRKAENGRLTVARGPQSEPGEIAKRIAYSMFTDADLMLGQPDAEQRSAAYIQRAIDEAAPGIRAKAMREAATYVASQIAIASLPKLDVALPVIAQNLRRMADAEEKT